MKQLITLASILLVTATGCGTAGGTGENGSNRANTGSNPTANTMTNTTAHSTGTGETTLQQPVDPFSNVYIEQKTRKSGKSAYSYPQIRGLSNQKVADKLNEALTRLGTPAPTDSTSTMQTSYTLLMKRGAFLELMLYSYNYPSGAAHGMPGQVPVMMNLKDGSIYQIGSLFKNGTDYLTRLSNGVRLADTEHVLDTFGPFKGVTNNDGFYLGDTGVTVFFSPYEWTPYALGFPQFTVSYSYLGNLMDTNGSLWKALTDESAKAEKEMEIADMNKVQSLGYNLVTDVESHFAQAAIGNGQTLYAFNASRKSVKDGSAQKIFFFLNNKYLGTDTAKDHGAIFNLTPTGKGSIAASYFSDKGDFTITYHWTGSHLQPNSPFPATYTDFG